MPGTLLGTGDNLPTKQTNHPCFPLKGTGMVNKQVKYHYVRWRDVLWGKGMERTKRQEGDSFKWDRQERPEVLEGAM